MGENMGGGRRNKGKGKSQGGISEALPSVWGFGQGSWQAAVGAAWGASQWRGAEGADVTHERAISVAEVTQPGFTGLSFHTSRYLARARYTTLRRHVLHEPLQFQFRKVSVHTVTTVTLQLPMPEGRIPRKRRSFLLPSLLPTMFPSRANSDGLRHMARRNSVCLCPKHLLFNHLSRHEH